MASVDKFAEKYELADKVGEGATSTVYICKSKKEEFKEKLVAKIMKFRDHEDIF